MGSWQHTAGLRSCGILFSDQQIVLCQENPAIPPLQHRDKYIIEKLGGLLTGARGHLEVKSNVHV